MTFSKAAFSNERSVILLMPDDDSLVDFVTVVVIEFAVAVVAVDDSSFTKLSYKATAMKTDVTQNAIQ